VTTELRLAFALNGGVSLAIWIGGVADEVLRCINGGRIAAEGGTELSGTDNPYAAVCAELGVRPLADVLTGTSAGGLNAVFLATAVSHGCRDLRPIRALWLEHGSFDKMMRPATDRTLVSLLAGDTNFLPHIEEALRGLAGSGTGYQAPDPPVVVRMTGTSLPGQATTLRDGHGAITSVDHRAEFTFRSADFDFEADPHALLRIARACRSSASFPGAFEPSSVEPTLFGPRHTHGLFEDGGSAATPVIDGGLLVNLPAQAALDAIVRQPSRERVDRVLALVVPDPGSARGAERLENPSLGQVVSKALLGIPLTQSLTDFVRVLDEHNREVRARRSARDALFAGFADEAPGEAWAGFADLAQTLFAAYRATRLAASLDRTRLAQHRDLRLAARAAGVPDLMDLTALGASHAPWVPERLGPGDGTWCWGSAAVRRLAGALITWVNTVAEVADPETAAALRALKADAAAARSRAERTAPSAGAIAGLLAEELTADPTSVAAAFTRACARWPGGARTPSEAIAELDDALVRLSDCVGRFVALGRDTIEHWTDDEDGRALRGVLRLADGAAASPGGLLGLVLCLEVVEGTFEGAEPRPDQEVRLVQFTSTAPADLDPLERSEPRDKLAGIELAHFGAFLKGSWRANDWLWGRLDAAQRLLRLLDSSTGSSLSRAGTLEAHTRTVQAVILREELPTLVAEIERDAALGAHVAPEARALVDAVRRAAGVPAGSPAPLDLSAVSEDDLRELLGLEQVGAEDVGQEVGSDLATVTSIGALSTSARVLHQQGPRVLRGPLGVLGASASFASRVAKRPWGRSLRSVLVALVVVTGLVGLVGSILGLLTDVDLGAWSYVSVACLLLTPVIAVLAAPWLLLGVGRRRFSRRT